jgi:hypothetical protein
MITLGRESVRNPNNLLNNGDTSDQWLNSCMVKFVKRERIELYKSSLDSSWMVNVDSSSLISSSMVENGKRTATLG